MSWVKVLLNPKTAGDVSKTISKVVGKYNIGNAGKIRNKAAISNLNKSTFEVNQAGKKFKSVVGRLGKKK